MLLFCPTCGNVLHVEEGSTSMRFACNTCPYICNISRRVSSRTYPKLKEVDDVLGGSAAWENVDSTEERCPKCSHMRAFFMQIQTRSADEPMTTFYKCCSPQCGHNWLMRLLSILGNKRMNPETMGPVKRHLNNAKETIKRLPENKNWFCGGFRSAAIASELLRNGKIIALPTDTIYGLAGLAQDDNSIARLYDIKKRDASNPLAICLCNVGDINNWADVQDLPDGLARALLPGPTTLILKRKESLNPSLNPGVTNVGIRIPKFDFVRSVVKMVNQPIALTSANVSRKRSTLHPSEFEELWPELDGVFYDKMNDDHLKNSWRKGSTVVDLSVKGEFIILRKGIGYPTTMNILKEFKLIERLKEKNVKSEATVSQEKEPEISEEIEVRASG